MAVNGRPWPGTKSTVDMLSFDQRGNRLSSLCVIINMRKETASGLFLARKAIVDINRFSPDPRCCR